ncbi:Molybdopterin synthase sulfur carrier subunit [Colletotrichum siamense]|uniref:Molybdopterin synthase sulfur carrier subunit n=1 Tax=Colletotrichum siamense TaxID=690259 RepID=UPI0018726019|nr:Molybdopterin synthase sulfur carrier subunit [Colletotrichum siamense]KAF5515298.1 Molybdopterin synthase sulfur carrier subunit [Colletotrichum siamense]
MPAVIFDGLPRQTESVADRSAAPVTWDGISSDISDTMSAATKPPKDHFNVLFFASAGSFTSKQSDVFPAPLPLKKLFEILEERYSGIKEKVLESCLVTVNLEYVDIPGPEDGDGPNIQAGDEVAIIPPVSSG